MRFIYFGFLLAFFHFLPSSAVPVVCYYQINSPSIDTVPVDKCSHIILIGSVNVTENGQLAANSEDIKQFSKLKERRPDLKLFFCVLSPNPHFSYLTKSKDLMSKFADDAVQLMNNNGLDGIDIDWEFPVWSQDAQKQDRAQFGNFLEILHQKLSPASKLLSIAVSGPPTITRVAYDVDAIRDYVDMVQVMNYDFHVFNKLKNPLVGFNAPLHAITGEGGILRQFNSEASMKTWLELGLPLNKTYFGVPTYGRAFQLLSKYVHKPYSPATRALPQYTNYKDICPFIKNPAYTKVWNSDAASPYLYGPGGIWISYETDQSVLAKVDFAVKSGAAGIMVFSIGNDDSTNECGYGNYPLLSKISKMAKTF